MFKFEKSNLLNRPQQEVFDYMSDPANDSKWQSDIESSKWTSGGAPGVGSTKVIVRRFLGRKTETNIVIKSWESPNSLIAKTVGGPIQVEIETTFEAQGSGTLMTLGLQMELSGLLKIAESFVGKQAEKQLETHLATLKQLLAAS